MLIGIVGLNGSGKDTVAKILVEKYSFEHYDLGQEIRDELKRLGKNPLSIDEMVSLGNERRKQFGADYWALLALKNYSPEKNFVITSIRNPAEAKAILSRNGFIVEVFAEQKLRYERVVSRVKNNPNSHGIISSFDDFVKKESEQLANQDPSKQQLLACMQLASYRINNNFGLKELEENVEKMLLALNSIK